jgi:carbon monoxide dehydrogenase subunit G
MFKKVLWVFLALVVVFVVVVSFQPAEFTISRTSQVSAPPAAVFAQVNDFHQWQAWSPWDKMDPSMKKEYAGPAQGEGSSYTWSGSGQVGEGKMTIVKSQPERIQIQLDFLKPMKATNQAEFTFQPQGQGTAVTWSMSGQKNFVAKAFGLFFNMDKLVGGEFEKGLASLKTLSEASVKQEPSPKGEKRG